WVYDDKHISGLQPLLLALFQTEVELTEQETMELVRLMSGPRGSDIAEVIPRLGVVLAVEKAFGSRQPSLQSRKDLMTLLRRLIADTDPKEQSNEQKRTMRKLGANDMLLQMDDPNAAFNRLAELLLDDATLANLVEAVRNPVE